LTFHKDQFLIIFDQVFNQEGVFYKAKTNANKLGLVSAMAVIIIKDEPKFVKSVYKYEGLEEQELTFPMNAYIRVLRKSIKFKKFDDEEWCEGAYQNRIGFFPSIFVEECFGEHWTQDSSPKTLDETLEKTLIENETSGENELIEQANSPLSPQQQVPQ
jgi:hypothetical protein